MDFDIESTIEDSIRLKKALQMSKFSCDKLEKELNEIKQFYEEQIQRNKLLKNDYCELQRKYQQSYTESIKDNNSLISQIEELKKIIDQKQRDMEQIQIKLIPSLDQDMLRVKLITEMEGPYQQIVDRKDQEIEKLKHKITELERNIEISSLSLKSKLQDLKKENQQIKARYEEETNRLMQELNIALSRYEVQSIEASIVKNQKKQIQQLKTTIQFVRQSEQKYLQQIKELKEERKNLLQKLMNFNSKEALLLEGKHNITQIEKLKEERLKQMRQIESLRAEKDKMGRQLSKLEHDKAKLINEHEKEITSERSKFINEKNQMNSEIFSLREELRMLKNYKIEGESDREVNHQKIKNLEKDLYQKTRQIEALRLESSRMTQKEIEPGCWPGFFGKQTEQHEILYKQRINQKKENDNTIINKKKEKDESRDKKIVQELGKENEKLKKKLDLANEKILELIRAKMKHGQNISPQRDRTSNDKNKPMGVFLEYEDCAFTPIIEPTLYRYQNSLK